MTGQPQNLRGLKALVGVMAVLIIIGTTVVVGTVIHRLYARFNSPPTPPLAAAVPVSTSVPASSVVPTFVTKLGAGEHIVEMASAGANIALLVATPQGQKLLILNPISGAVKTVLTSP